MFARVVTYAGGDPTRVEEIIAAVKDRFTPDPPSELDEAKSFWMLVDRQKAQVFGISLFEDGERLRRGMNALDKLPDPAPEAGGGECRWTFTRLRSPSSTSRHMAPMSVEFWRMGATPVPVAEIGRFAREFEDAGWDGLAVGEAHGLIPDPYAVLAAAAEATTTLRVGTSVAVPLRHPLLAASAMATLHAISGGRASFSIGRGDGAVKVLQQKPMPVGRFETYLSRLQGFLRREDVEIDGVVSSMARLDDIDPSIGIPKPLIDVAATGPRTIEVAVKTADGVSFSVGADVERLRNSIELVRDACRAFDRDVDTLRLGSYIQVAVTNGDTSGREAIRGLVVTHARFSGFEAKPASDVAEAEHTRYQQAVETMEAVYRSSRGGVGAYEPAALPARSSSTPAKPGRTS